MSDLGSGLERRSVELRRTLVNFVLRIRRWRSEDDYDWWWSGRRLYVDDAGVTPSTERDLGTLQGALRLWPQIACLCMAVVPAVISPSPAASIQLLNVVGVALWAGLAVLATYADYPEEWVFPANDPGVESVRERYLRGEIDETGLEDELERELEVATDVG